MNSKLLGFLVVFHRITFQIILQIYCRKNCLFETALCLSVQIQMIICKMIWIRLACMKCLLKKHAICKLLCN